MKKYLDTFNQIILPLRKNYSGSNVYIGGSAALKLHGLTLNREINDLDIVILNSTNQQADYLESIKFFNTPVNEKYPNGNTCLRFVKDNLVLNVLLDRKENFAQFNEDDLLYYSYQELFYKVCPVSMIMEAKRKYIKERTEGNYVRQKDMLDFIDLKNSNFNY